MTDTHSPRSPRPLRPLSLLLLGLPLLLATPALAAEPVQDLRQHTSNRDVNEAVIGEAPTERAGYLEDYLLDESRLEKLERDYGRLGVATLRRAYANRLFRPVWTREGVESLRAATDDLFAHGIIAEDVFDNDLDKLARKRFESRSEKTQAKADLRLSLMWLNAAEAIGGDLSEERQMERRKRSPNLRFALPESLLRSAEGRSVTELEDLAPDAPQYDRLQTALANYRNLRRQGGWGAIADGEAVEPGETDPRMVDLRTRLLAEGYAVSLPEGADAEVMDDNLAAALKLFQRRHGLEDDGVLGGHTLRALNESVESKIARISDTLYRWRVQGELGERYIWANLPSYTAEGWDNDRMEIRQRTIIGKRRFATPEFSDDIEYMVANPKWYLPVSIVRRQKLPKLRRDPSYAARNGYHIFDRATGARVSAASVDWNQPGVATAYRFVQQPGEGNALGEMKIIFPNQYSVYLHGTPGEALFEKAHRAFSSGCVRLEDPVAMGRWIARHDPAGEVAQIDMAMVENAREKIELEEHVPVHITYMTVTVDELGQTVFWRDVYDRLEDEIKMVERYESQRDKRIMRLRERVSEGR